MELRYVLVTLLKILISTPNVLLLYNINEVYSSALMGGYLDNKSNSSINVTDMYYEYDLSDNQEYPDDHYGKESKTNSEEIPDPSALVLPGYNLPENIFNHGKPFYVEKDPLTGNIDFSQKSPTLKLDPDLYEYVDEEPSDNIYDKANIDRKDGSVNSHKPSDVNQLTPNFHDFLNLPVKYNPDKYVYPLISNSYASTKVQGSVNKFHNHKDYDIKTTTKKTTESPTYFSTNKYFNTNNLISIPTATTTTTTPLPTTKLYPSNDFTPKPLNLMNSEMSHPSFNEEFEYYDEPSTTKQTVSNNIYLTTENINNIRFTTRSPFTTTKRTLSLFEQLFGDYEDNPVTTGPKPLIINYNLSETNKKKYGTEKDNPSKDIISNMKSTSINNFNNYQNAHAGPNMFTSSTGLDNNYNYEEYNTKKFDDSRTEINTSVKNVEDDLTIEPLHVVNTKKESDKIVETTSKSQPKESTTTTYVITDYEEYDYEEKDETTTIRTATLTPKLSVKPTTTLVKNTVSTPIATVRVTSLPLGENHVTNNNREQINPDPIIVATQNLKEKLNSEKVLSKPFEKPITEPGTQFTQPPSTSNIHIAPDQDTVSFVVGNHQNIENTQYTGTAIKESPYDSNPFKPLYGQQATYSTGDSSSYIIENEPEVIRTPISLGQSYPEVVGSAVTIQPLKNSEASLAIGVPVSGVKQVPGQVVDEKLEINNDPIEFPKGTGNKIIFPNEKPSQFPNLVPPPTQQHAVPTTLSNRDILPLNSKPVYHQLPSSLTPPKETEVIPPIRRDHRPVRPPWDPRPGHFHTGKPEYNRPPRPPLEMSYKRIDNLPNILPQFRPNMNKHFSPGHYVSNKLVRQPLLERPSNRPIGFFEKLQPPPPPPFPVHKNFQNLRKILPSVTPPRQSLDETQIAQDRIINGGPPRKPLHQPDQFGFYQTPPQIKIANRRSSDDATEIETLQMIQAKNSEKTENVETAKEPEILHFPSEDKVKDSGDKTIYKVYPVNTPPIKLDVIENTKKESVVIGTRAELPLPPSKINKDFIYEQNPLFDLEDRNDAPVLKPHSKPYSTKSDFPYPLERPGPGIIHPPVPEVPSNIGNGIDDSKLELSEGSTYLSNNQWNTVGQNLEPRIVNSQKLNGQNSNQISVTLKTYTEKPIAIAYTPTEPSLLADNIYTPTEHNLNVDKYSMPNYGSPVIPEIRPGTVENANVVHSNNEFTVSAVMHTHHHNSPGKVHPPNEFNKRIDEYHQNSNHKSDTDGSDYPKLDFEAPFQASVSIEHLPNQGWSIVKHKNKTTTEATGTTMSYATTKEFDIENFKPQLEGGFKPIYNVPDNDKKLLETVPSERQE